jgi:hypothetical protein
MAVRTDWWNYAVSANGRFEADITYDYKEIQKALKGREGKGFR